MRFMDRVVVVTGAGSGIGAQISLDLLSEGATICLAGRTVEKLEKIKTELEKACPSSKNVVIHPCNVSLETEVHDFFCSLRKKGLLVDGLVNSAALNPSRNNILNTSVTDWRQTIDTNLTGCYNCMREAIPHMLELKRGSIVNIASIAGVTAMQNRAAYMSSKWGLIGLSLSASLDFAANNIRVNVIAPGYIRTPLVTQFLDGLPQENYEAIVNSHPMKRLGTSKDISQAVLFLLSQEASWITGAVLPVDGGYRIGKEY